ncbi:MAG: hypothetical protein AAGF12_30760 [Myxococcota bacterium]
MDKLKGMLGGAADAAQNAANEAANATQQAVNQAEQGANPAAPEQELSPAQEEWRDLQQMIARVESQGVDLAGNDPANPAAFWTQSFAIEELQGQGHDQDTAAQQHGYQNHDHYYTVRNYITAKWSELTRDEDGDEVVRVKDEFTNAMMQARMGQMQGMQQAAMAANPQMLEPVNGVTVEQWAGASAALGGLGAGATMQQAAEALAKFGLDKATYDAASAGWQAKMQGDTTGAIATAYGQAFAAAQGQGGGYNLNQAGQGEAPCTFEQFVEVMVAQGCWSEQGIEIASQLQATFGIDVMTYSKWSSYWSPMMSTDIAYTNRFTQLEEQYKQKYAGAGMDDDLSI